MTGLGTVLLDCEALSRLLRDDRIMAARIKAAQVRGVRVLVCAMTVVEAAGARIRPERVMWTLSRLNVEPVTDTDARAAHRLLAEHGLHGHEYAIDAAVAVLAARSPGPVTLLTSDPEDLAVLCGPRVRVVKV